MARLRHIARLMVPWWLFVNDGQKIVEAFALLTDVYRQRLRSGLEARFPSRAGESAAALIGKYRLIPRGRDETLAHYAQRLKAWRYPRGHRVRGNAFALLTQVYHYWGGVACWVHDRNQNYRALDADAATSYSYGVAWDWDGGAAAQWGRQWLVIDLSDVASTQDDFTDGGTIGIGDTTPGDWVAMRRLVDDDDPHRWMAAGTQPEWCVVSLDGTDPTPDLTWAYWGVESGSVVLPARSAGFRYVALRVELKDYPGEADRAAAAFWMPYGFTVPSLSTWTSYNVTPVDAGDYVELTEAVVNNLHMIYTGTSGADYAAGTATYAVRARQGTGDRHLKLATTVGADLPAVVYDLSDGSVVQEEDGARGYCDGVADAAGFYTCIFTTPGPAVYLRYMMLDSSYTDSYLGDGSSSIRVQEVQENLRCGDPAEFPAAISLPDGSSYAGDPAQFRATITLPDDGDRPA